MGGGSGFVISDEGHILTNDHVVSGANEVLVYFSDRTVAEAEIIGTDPFPRRRDQGRRRDRLQPLSFGDSDATEVGQWILAIGNPGFGVGNQLDFVTAEIISARGRLLQLIQRELQRELNANYAIEDFIQTDAVINPGTGRTDGRHHGPRGRHQLGDRLAHRLLPGLRLRHPDQPGPPGHGRSDRVRLRPACDPRGRDQRGLAGGRRVLRPPVGERRADQQPGRGRTGGARGFSEDIIIEIDGQMAGYVGGLQAMVARKRPGEAADVVVFRDGERRNFTVRLGEAELQDAPVVEHPGRAHGCSGSRCGSSTRRSPSSSSSSGPAAL